MRISDWLIEKRREHRRCNLARSVACEAFERAYPDKSVDWALKPQQNIVCVCYGTTRPPQRSWWLVDDIAGTAREMTYEEATKIIPIPPWR